MLIVALVLFLPSLAAADITKTFKISGFFGNEACGGYEDTSQPTAKNCSDLTAATFSDYANLRLADNNNIDISGLNGSYEVTIAKINASLFTTKANITSIAVGYSGSQDSSANPSGFYLYMRNFSSNAWILKNNINYTNVTLPNQLIPASARTWTNISFSPNNNTGTFALGLPWQFKIYGAYFNQITISADGYITFGDSDRMVDADNNLWGFVSGRNSIPDCPGAARYNITENDTVIFWDNVCADAKYSDNPLQYINDSQYTFQIQLFRNNTIKMHYGNYTISSLYTNNPGLSYISMADTTDTPPGSGPQIIGQTLSWIAGNNTNTSLIYTNDDIWPVVTNITPNLVLNPGFENGSGGDASSWPEPSGTSRTSGDKYSGSFSMSMFPESQTNQTIRVTAEKIYNLSAWIKTDYQGGIYNAFANVSARNSANGILCSFNYTNINVWTQGSCLFNATENSVNIVLNETYINLSLTVWFDDVSLMDINEGKLQEFVSNSSEVWVLVQSQNFYNVFSQGQQTTTTTLEPCLSAYAFDGENYTYVKDFFPFVIMQSLQEKTYAEITGLASANGKYEIRISNGPDEISHVKDVKLYGIKSSSTARFVPDKDGTIHSIQETKEPFKKENNTYYFSRPAKKGFKLIIRAGETNLVRKTGKFLLNNLGANNYEFYDSFLSLPFINDEWRKTVERTIGLKVYANGKLIETIKPKLPTNPTFKEKRIIPEFSEYLVAGKAEESDVLKIELRYADRFFVIDDVKVDYSDDEAFEIKEIKGNFEPFEILNYDYRDVYFDASESYDKFILAIEGWDTPHWALGKNVSLDESLKYFYSDVMPAVSGEENYVEKNRKGIEEINLNIDLTDEKEGNTLTMDYFYINVTYTGTDTAKPNVSYISPANNTRTTNTNINFTFNVTDNSNINNCSLYINNIFNGTLFNIDDYFTFNFSRTLPNQKLNWSINCTDTSNNMGTGGKFNLTIDNVPPTIAIQSPAHRSEYEESTPPSLNFIVSDNIELDECWYQIKECSKSFGPEQNLTNCNNLSSVGNTTFSCNTLRVYANDTLNNINSSEVNFTFFLSSGTYKTLFGRSVATIFSVAIGGNIDGDFVIVDDSFITQEEEGNNVVFAVIGKNSGTRFSSVNSTIWAVESKQPLQNNKMFIGFTKGGSNDISNKLQEINRFNMISKTIGTLNSLISERVFLRLEYKDIDILDSLRIPSQRDIIIENEGRDNSLTKIGINRREG